MMVSKWLSTLAIGMLALQACAAEPETASPPALSTPNTAGAPQAAAPDKAPENIALKTDDEKVSYAIGANVALDLKKAGFLLNAAAMMQGVKDALADKVALSEAERMTILSAWQSEMQQKQAAIAQAAAPANLKKGQDFLAKNKSEKGVVALPSGLQYKILTEGTGAKPKLTDKVECHYRGTLLDGTEFDSSYRRGRPAEFPVNGVIAGWTEALQLMPVGSKWQLFIPSDLAYGARGAGGNIGPNETLIFEVELLGIK